MGCAQGQRGRGQADAPQGQSGGGRKRSSKGFNGESEEEPTAEDSSRLPPGCRGHGAATPVGPWRRPALPSGWGGVGRSEAVTSTADVQGPEAVTGHRAGGWRWPGGIGVRGLGTEGPRLGGSDSGREHIHSDQQGSRDQTLGFPHEAGTSRAKDPQQKPESRERQKNDQPAKPRSPGCMQEGGCGLGCQQRGGPRTAPCCVALAGMPRHKAARRTPGLLPLPSPAASFPANVTCVRQFDARRAAHNHTGKRRTLQSETR